MVFENSKTASSYELPAASDTGARESLKALNAQTYANLG